MLRNTKSSYGLIAKSFHWLSAVTILALFISGIWMTDLDYEHFWYDYAAHYHESVGVLFAIFVIFRLLWRQINIKPNFSETLSVVELKAAKLAHNLLYLLCIMIIITGYLIPTADNRGLDVFTWFTVPSLGSFHHQQADFSGKAHYLLSWGLITLSFIHALAACKHHFIDNDNTLKKIL